MTDNQFNYRATDQFNQPATGATEIVPESTATPAAVGTAQSRVRDAEPIVPLFSAEKCQSLRTQWDSLQAGFVDEPRQAVEQADRLVNEAIDELTKGFSAQRAGLEQHWHSHREISTEDLRLALRRYRSFFERLLTM